MRMVIGLAGAVLWVASMTLGVSADPSTNEDLRDGQIVVSVETNGRAHDPFEFQLIDLATGSTQVLASYSNGDQATAPSWSPDGRYLLYSMNRDSAGVYIYDTTEHRRTRLDEPGDFSGACRAAWSPDGFQIVYQSGRFSDYLRSKNPYDLYVYDVRTRKHRRLTWQSGGHPAWSPDGDWIVYYSPARDAQLFRIHPDGTGDERFLYQNDPNRRARAVGWSPDSARIAFTVVPWRPGQETRPDLQVFTADSNGQGAALVTRGRWNGADPVFAPREGRLAMLVVGPDVIGPASIRLVENGTTREIVGRTYNVDGQRWNFWSPNGRAIAYTPFDDRSLEGKGLDVLNLDDGSVRRFLEDRHAAYPVWRPVRH